MEMTRKRYYVQDNIGSVKYVVMHHDGEKTHRDGSEFYDIATFRNKKKQAKFIKQLETSGYKSEY